MPIYNPAVPYNGNAATYLDGTGDFTVPGGSTPAGTQLDYVQITAPVSITATTAAGADTCITGTAVVYDGATEIKIEYFAPYLTTVATSAAGFLVELYDGTTDLGALTHITNHASASILRMGGSGSHVLTPTAASHTYSIRAWTTAAGTGAFGAGAGGAGAYLPAYIRITAT